MPPTGDSPKIGAQPRASCAFFRPPGEIEAIGRGGYREYVGLFVNDGRATWIGFDGARIVKIDQWAGGQARFAPALALPGSERIVHASGGVIDLVARRTLSAEQVAQLTRLATELWAAPLALPRPMTDVHNAIVLLDGDSGKCVGGPGGLPAGPAAELGGLLATLVS